MSDLFQTAITYPATNYDSSTNFFALPNSLAIADLNGDGRLDLLVDSGSGGVSGELSGNGSGGFSVPSIFVPGGAPVSVAIGDLNGDGVPDLVFAISLFSAATVTVLLGQGNGTYAAPRTFTTNSNSMTAVTTADMNGDGKLDIVATDAFGGAWVFLGNGAGNFAAAKKYAVNYAVEGVTTADLNRDGRLDIIVAGDGTVGDVQVLLANGSGGYTAAVQYNTGSPTQSVTTADVNGDGVLDIIAASNAGAVVLLGNGDGSFRPAVTYAAGPTPTSVVVSDVNGDGKLDLVASDGGGGVSVLLGDGSGAFAAPLAFAAGPSSAAVKVADLNGDGRPDIAVADQTGTVSVLLNSATTTIAVTAITATPSVSGPLHLGDEVTFDLTIGSPIILTGDVTLLLTNQAFATYDASQSTATDLIFHYTVAAGDDTAALSVFGLGINGAIFTPDNIGQAVSYDAGPVPYSVAVGDFNRDGKLDLVVANEPAGISVLLGDGSGGFAAPVAYNAGAAPVSVTTADVNGDGKQDVIVADAGTGVSVLLGDGSGGFAAPVSYAVGRAPIAVAASDVNHDGKVDLVVADALGGIAVMQNNGAGAFIQTGTFAAGSKPSGITLADINGDANLDAIVTNNSGGISILTGNASGGFNTAVSYATGNHPVAVAAGDLNGDGKTDLVVANQSGGIAVLLNAGGGTFAPSVIYDAGLNPKSVTLADINRDGKLDIVVANNTDDPGSAAVLLGDGQGGFGPVATYEAGLNPYLVSTADLNADGTPDIIVADQGGGIDVLLNNNQLTTFDPKTVATAPGHDTGLVVDTACYARGTRIATPAGERAIEDLRAGDLVLTASGEPRPVRWLGHRRIDTTRHPEPQAVWPICVSAGAFGPNKPWRDLWLSPGHNIAAEGVLMPASLLVNGVSVIQHQQPAVEYWHVELDRHDIILAEGLEAESYLDTGNRTAFVNGGGFIEAHPDFAPKHWAETCVPLVHAGAQIARTKARLIDRAGTFGFTVTGEADLHILADRMRFEPFRLSDDRLAFMLPAGCREILLSSNTFVPAHTCPGSQDGRDLGIDVRRLQIDGEEIALDAALLSGGGWNEPEREGKLVHRWTTGQALLPAESRLILLDLNGRGYYWTLRAENAVPISGQGWKDGRRRETRKAAGARP